jgi:hypothetical protein
VDKHVPGQQVQQHVPEIVLSQIVGCWKGGSLKICWQAVALKKRGRFSKGA